jgi:Flp pilus assembly protein TadD
MSRAPIGLLCLALLAGCPAKRSAVDERPAAAASADKRQKPKRPPPDVPESGPLAQKILYEQAKGLLRTGKLEQAVALFRRSIEAHPRGELLASCYLGLGAALGDLGRLEEAVRAYREVTALSPSDPEAFRALAVGLEEAGKLAQARQALEQALALDADQPAIYQDLASIYLREKDLEAAKQTYLRYELARTRLILRLARGRDEEMRLAAAVALGEARDDATVKALGLALTDPSPQVRLAVIRALGQQGLAAGAGPLRELLARSKDAEQKRAIEASLAAINSAPQPAPASLPSGKPGRASHPPKPTAR